MAFPGWRPGSFELDAYVLSPTGRKARRRPPPLDLACGDVDDEAGRELQNGFCGSWRELGFDTRIVEVLQKQGCRQPTELQQRIATSLLARHHLDISAPPLSGVSTIVAAASLHTLPPKPSSSTSLLLLTTSTERASFLHAKLTSLSTPFELCLYKSTDGTPLWDDLESLRTSASVPEALVATFGRFVTLLEHGALDVGSLSLVCIDVAGVEAADARAARSHHTISDVRAVLDRVGSECQIVVLGYPGYERTALGGYVDACQQKSIRQNLCRPLSMKQDASQTRQSSHGRTISTTSLDTAVTTLSGNWRRVVEDFEYRGLKPEDFLDAKKAHEIASVSSVQVWASSITSPAVVEVIAA